MISTRGTSANRVSSITQTGATWAFVEQATNAAGTTMEIWYAPNVSGAGTTATINLAASLRAAAVIVEYRGLLTPTSYDVSNNATGNSDSASTGTTLTTTQANELWFGGIGLVNSSYTLGSITNSFTSVANTASTSGTQGDNAKVYALERIVSATGTANSGGTITSSQWSGAIATFKSLEVIPTSFTVSAGSNRLTLAGVCLETNNNTTISSIDVRLDSPSGTHFTLINQSTGSQRENCYLGYLNDASVSTGTHQIYLSVTMAGNTITGVHVDVGTYQGVDQFTPITASAANNASSNTITFGSEVSYAANSTTVYMAGLNNTASGVTHATSFTEAVHTWGPDESTCAAEVNNVSAGSYPGTSQVVFTGGQSRSAIVVASLNPVFVDHFAISAIASPQTAGTAITGITLTAQDASNNTVTSFAGTVDYSGTAGITGTSEAFTEGQLTGVSVTPTVAGNGMTFIVAGLGKTGTATFDVEPGALDHFAISTISSPQTAGTAITGITLTAQDASNNTVTSFTGTVEYSGTAGITGTSEAFTAGQLTGVSVTPTLAGSGMTFIVTGSGLTGTAMFDVDPGAMDHFAISTISSPQTAGIAITGITLTAQDASNNTVTSFTGTVEYSGTAGITGTSEAFTAGQLTGVSVTPTVAGSGMTFIVTGLGKTGTATFDVEPGALDHFAISTISSPQTAGTAITGITLTAQDANNNTVTGFSGTVDYSGTAGITGTSAAFTAGQLTGVSVTPTLAGGGMTFIVTGSGKSGTATFDVNKGDQVIMFTSTPPSHPVVGGASYKPTATGGASGMPVVITLDITSTGCSINPSGVVYFNEAGFCVINADQTGNANYNPADQAQQSFEVFQSYWIYLPLMFR